jgi:lipid A disaccharide synthetase
MKEQGPVLFTHENDAMDFLHDRADIMVTSDSKGFNIRLPSSKRSHFTQSVEYAGKRYPVPEQGLAL